MRPVSTSIRQLLLTGGGIVLLWLQAVWAVPKPINAQQKELVLQQRQGAVSNPKRPTSPVNSYIFSAKQEASARELLHCNFTTPNSYDPYLVLRKLYGPWFEPNVSGAGSMLILGQHNSGTSMLARLLMLMGSFQGNVKGLSTSRTNRLKYWEKIDVTHFHDMVLSWVTDPKFKPYHTQGIDMKKLTDRNRENLSCFAKKIIKDLDRHKPWVLKDPRMLLFANYWIQEMKDPVCVFIFREPIANAVSLAENTKKSGASAHFKPMTPQRWLQSWEEGMLSALQACEEHPTVLVQLEDMREDLSRFAYKLYAMLGQVGVYHLQMPPKKVLDSEFGANLKPKHRPEADTKGVALSRNQTALYSAMLMVANSANQGLTEDFRRAAAVLRMYEDTIGAWDDL